MASTHGFLLTPQQQELLFAALNANRPITGSTAVTDTPATTKPADLVNGIADSSFLDYDYSFDGADTSLDFSLGGGDHASSLDNDDGDGDGDDAKTDSAPSNADNDSPDKRSHPEDDDDEDGAAAKRHESTEKVPKKPGRKPLTSEPSSKRKAQNRAAQRAFRERKEKHLKDLETKVAELEKASETANNENDVLRAQVEKMTVELNEYKKRMELLSKSRSPYVQAGRHVFGNPLLNNINDVSFQFEFPKFGQLPGPGPAPAPLATTPAATPSTTNNNNSPSALSSYKRGLSFDTLNTPSPVDLPGLSTSTTSNANSPADSVNNGLIKKTTTTTNKDDLSKLSNVFTPPLSNVNTSRSSMDSGCTSSPSSSTHTNTAPSSSCGTSPEPYTQQSPMGFKAVDTMATIGEEQAAMFAANTNTNQEVSQFANVDVSDVTWLNGQTNFQFDPQLFGDYREPQDNILANGGFEDSFFNDALEVDFTTPFNMAPSPIGTTTAKANNMIAQIDAAKEGEFASSSIADTITKPSVSVNGGMLTCNVIWERLQSCPKVQSGDFDLDGLCSDLQKKAKCSGSGAVVDEMDFKLVMNKYLDKEGESECSKELLGDIKTSTA